MSISTQHKGDYDDDDDDDHNDDDNNNNNNNMVIFQGGLDGMFLQHVRER